MRTAIIQTSKILLIMILVIAFIISIGIIYYYFVAIRSVYSPREAVIFWDHPLVDKSFITNQPCAAPCWYGLIINKSSYEDVEKLLEGLPFVEQKSVRISYDTDGATNIHFNCPYEINHVCGFISVFDDKVQRIITLVAYELTFEEIVKRHGPPDTVYYFEEPNGCSLILNWPTLMIRAENISPYDSSLCRDRSLWNASLVPSNLQVTSLEYLSKELYLKCGDFYYCSSWGGFEETDDLAPE